MTENSVINDETMHVCIVEPEIKSLLLSKTGTWRYLRPVMKTKTPPCAGRCPAAVKVRDCLSLVHRGMLKEAWDIIREDNPFPAITGRVCYHTCEKDCNRLNFDKSVAIHSIERVIGDYGLQLPSRKHSITKKEKIAIIGSGPAGLSCGYYCAKQGYSVAIFEALHVAGGMLRVGIPDYRLPPTVLDDEIKWLEMNGIDIKLNSRVEDIDALFNQGFDAVFISIGAHHNVKLGIEGEDLPHVVGGATFLKNVKLGQKVEVGNNVGVIGGGNVAIDSARIARRLGTEKVTIYYRRTKDEMPANAEELDAALAEGIEVAFLVAPKQININTGELLMTLNRMELGKPDASGRRIPKPVKGSEFVVKVNTIISAIGQLPEIPFKFNVKVTNGNTVGVDPKTLATNRKGVWAGGDAVSGPASVCEAIAAGKKAARAIIATVENKVPSMDPETNIMEFDEMNPAYFVHKTRVSELQISPKLRLAMTKEVNLGFSKEDAMKEAERCFHCGECNRCGNCWFFCPDLSVHSNNGNIEIDYEYCKGCGICSEECPSGALMMEEEIR